MSFKRLYESSFYDIALFAWVEGQRRLIPTCSIDQSIGLFIKYFDLDRDADSLAQSYQRMKKRFYDTERL